MPDLFDHLPKPSGERKKNFVVLDALSGIVKNINGGYVVKLMVHCFLYFQNRYR